MHLLVQCCSGGKGWKPAQFLGLMFLHSTVGVHMSRHSRQPAASVWHTYAMLARRVERPCCLIIRIGQNCPKIPRILYDQGTMTCSSMVPPGAPRPWNGRDARCAIRGFARRGAPCEPRDGAAYSSDNRLCGPLSGCTGAHPGRWPSAMNSVKGETRDAREPL